MTPTKQPLNAKGRPFSWSYSALSDFEGCPKRYAEARFYCRAPFVETQAIIDGNRVHKAAEQFLKGEHVTDPEMLPRLQPYLNTLKKAGEGKVCKLEAELEICLTKDFRLVSWFSKEAWFRIKIDVALLNFDKGQANIYDWKTGKLKDNPDQLKISAAALAHIYPGFTTFVPKYIWLKDKEITGIGGAGIITKDEIPGIWEGILGRVRRMEEAWATEYFPARPSGLCKWKTGQCASYDRCEEGQRR